MARNVYPAPGTPKPMQRGGATLPNGVTDVTIATVNMAKARLNVIGPGIGSSFSYAPGFTAKLLNSTTIRFTNGSGGANVSVEYEVEETY